MDYGINCTSISDCEHISSFKPESILNKVYFVLERDSNTSELLYEEYSLYLQNICSAIII